MPDLDRFRPFLWAATVLCLLAGIVAIPIVGPRHDEPAAARTDLLAGAGGDATTTTAAAAAAGGGATDPAAGAAGDPAAAPPSTASPTANAAVGAKAAAAPTTAAAPAPTTTAPATENLGAPSDPGPAKPPRAGTYRYKASSSDGKTSEATTQVEDQGTQGNETHQVVKQRGQEGANLDNDVVWRPDAVYVLVSRIQFGQSSFTCDWNPDTLQLKLPLSPGTTWESTSSCTDKYNGTPITVTRKLSAKISELRRVKVAGKVVDVWAIDSTDHIEVLGGATDTTGTTLFSPEHGLIVRSDATTTTKQGAKQMTLELQNLDPE